MDNYFSIRKYENFGWILYCSSAVNGGSSLLKLGHPMYSLDLRSTWQECVSLMNEKIKLCLQNRYL